MPFAALRAVQTVVLTAILVPCAYMTEPVQSSRDFQLWLLPSMVAGMPHIGKSAQNVATGSPDRTCTGTCVDKMAVWITENAASQRQRSLQVLFYIASQNDVRILKSFSKASQKFPKNTIVPV